MENTNLMVLTIVLFVGILTVNGCTSQNQITGEVVRETREPTGPEDPSEPKTGILECEEFESNTHKTTCYMQHAITEGDETICDNIKWNTEQKLACRDAVKQFKDLGYLGDIPRVEQ